MQLPKLYAQNVAKKKIDLTLSTNPLGCSPAALTALRNLTGKDLSQYPDTILLIIALTKKFKIKPENLLLGNGSEQLIKLVSQTFLRPDDIVLVQNGSFALFTKEPQLVGAKTILFEPQIPDFSLKPTLIFISNPSTPTGEIFPKELLINLSNNFPAAILVVDEANGEYQSSSFVTTAVRSNNTLVLRTFSKVLGLAGLRVGCAIGPRTLIAKLTISQQPFAVSSLAATAAVATLADKAFIKKSLNFITSERRFLSKKLSKRGFTVANSVTNNLFISRPDAKRIIRQLGRRGVAVIENSFFPGLTTVGFRISIKDKQTNRLFLKILDQVLACVNKNKLLPSKEKL